MPSVVFAASNAVLKWKTRSVTIRRGDAWAANDPLVRHYPSMFTADPPHIHHTEPIVVEQATAAPGESRRVKRGS